MVDTSSIGAFINQHQCGGGTHCTHIAVGWILQGWQHLLFLILPHMCGLCLGFKFFWSEFEPPGKGLAGDMLWAWWSFVTTFSEVTTSPCIKGMKHIVQKCLEFPSPPKKRKRSLLSRKRCSVSQVSPKYVKSSQGIQNSILVTRLCLGFWSWKSPADQLLGGAVHKTEEVDGLYALRSFGNSSLGTLCSSAMLGSSIMLHPPIKFTSSQHWQKPHSMVLELQWTWFSPMQYSKL